MIFTDRQQVHDPLLEQVRRHGGFDIRDGKSKKRTDSLFITQKKDLKTAEILRSVGSALFFCAPKESCDCHINKENY